jgi:hypothetical protein
MYSITEVAMRSCIEVDPKYNGSLTADGQDTDPLDLFVRSLRNGTKGTDEIERTNKRVLSNLISNGHISRSSIIWNKDKIYKIYGLKVDDQGRIKYDKQTSHEQKQPSYINADATKVDLSEIRSALIRTKQAAV